jgi:hypothetical protein
MAVSYADRCTDERRFRRFCSAELEFDELDHLHGRRRVDRHQGIERNAEYRRSYCRHEL